MKNSNLRIILAVLICLSLSVGAIFWAISLMDSLFAYRSPLQENPPEPGLALGEPITRRVVFVIIDALREDTSRNRNVMPFLNELRDQGAWALMHSQPPSYSEPGYSVLLTGAWPDISDGPAMNLLYDDIPVFTQDNLFSAVHRSGYRTAISGYYWFEKLIPQDSVTASFYTPGEDQKADRVVVDAALPWLSSVDCQLVLIHLDQVDYAGHHEGGPRDPRWDQAAGRVDSLLREVVAELDLALDTLLVVSDHGQIDLGGHGGHEAVTLLEPFILVGAGINPGFYGDIYMVDVAPTVAALLGVNLPATSQGAVQVDMLSYPGSNYQILLDAAINQQEQLLERYSIAIDSNAVPQPSVINNTSSPGDIVDAYQQELNALRESRLNSERFKRFSLVFIIAVISIVIIFRKRGRLLHYQLIGALVYIFLFHTRYAFIDGNTYSLSSVTSAEGLINYVFITSFLALVASWLLVSLITKLFSQPGPLVFEMANGMILVMIYMVSLPILLSYSLNGLTVTWTLPHFPSLFLAFLSVLQVAVLAGGGLLLGAISVILSWIYRRTWIQKH